MQISRRRIRLACNTLSTGQVKDVFTGASPDGWNSNDTQIEIAIFAGDDLVTDIANIQSLTLAINQQNDRKTAVITPVTIAAVDLDDTLTQATWNDGTKQHALFTLTNEQFNFDLGGETSKSFWLAVYVTTTDTPAQTYTVGTSILRILEDGTPPAGSPAPGDPLYLDAAQSDARYQALITGAQEIRVGGVAGNDDTGTRGRPDKPFATIGAALAVAQSGDRVLVASGTYVTTAALDVPDGVSLRGAGMAVTTITNAVTDTIVNLLGSSEVEGFTITGTSTTIYQMPIHVNPAEAGKLVVLRSLTLNSDTDGVYVAWGAALPTVIGYDLVIRTKFDAVNVFAESGATVRLYNPDILVSGPSSAGAAEHLSRGIAVTTEGTIECYGGRICVSDGGSTGTYGVSAQAGLVRVIGTDIQASSSSGPAYDLYATLGSIEVAGCTFDPDATSGTVSYLDAPVVLAALATIGIVVPIGASLAKTADQPVASGGQVLISWATVQWDDADFFDAANSAIVVPADGRYAISFSYLGDDADWRTHLYRNRTHLMGLHRSTAQTWAETSTVELDLTAGDSLTIYAEQYTGISKTIVSAAGTRFAIRRIK